MQRERHERFSCSRRATDPTDPSKRNAAPTQLLLIHGLVVLFGTLVMCSPAFNKKSEFIKCVFSTFFKKIMHRMVKLWWRRGREKCAQGSAGELAKSASPVRADIPPLLREGGFKLDLLFHLLAVLCSRHRN